MRLTISDKIYGFIFIFFFSCSPQVKLNSETNYTGLFGSDVPIYISNFPSYTFDQKRIRDKLKIALQNNGYFIVDNIKKSEFYLIFKSDCFSNNTTKKNKMQCEMNFVLIKTDERNNYFNSEGYLNTIIWRLVVDFDINTVIKLEDKIIDKVSKVFLKNA